LAEEQAIKQAEKKTIPVEEGLFTMPDSPEGFHLLGSRCKVCGTVGFPQKKRCIKCFSDQIEVIPLSSRGKVTTWTVIRMKPFGYRDKVPYILADIQLPKGPHIVTQLSGINPEKPEINIGDEVENILETIYQDENGNDVVCYKFKKV
jgi:uncharacterized protein